MQQNKTKKMLLRTVGGAIVLSFTLPISAFADHSHVRTITIRNDNTAQVSNSVGVNANTGHNVANGGTGGDGGNGGEATGGSSSEDDNSTDAIGGDGGNGGNGGMGGIITTGDITSEATINNEVNTSETDLEGDCGCGSGTTTGNGDEDVDDLTTESTTTLETTNDVNVGNGVSHVLDTGWNVANGESGGMGGAGGSAATNTNSENDNQASTTTRGGRGGNGGTGGIGGDILTGIVTSRTNMINVLNKTITRTHR